MLFSLSLAKAFSFTILSASTNNNTKRAEHWIEKEILKNFDSNSLGNLEKFDQNE